jgi:hypothetical protein
MKKRRFRKSWFASPQEKAALILATGGIIVAIIQVCFGG